VPGLKPGTAQFLVEFAWPTSRLPVRHEPNATIMTSSALRSGVWRAATKILSIWRSARSVLSSSGSSYGDRPTEAAGCAPPRHFSASAPMSSNSTTPICGSSPPCAPVAPRCFALSALRPSARGSAARDHPRCREPSAASANAVRRRITRRGCHITSTCGVLARRLRRTVCVS